MSAMVDSSMANMLRRAKAARNPDKPLRVPKRGIGRRWQDERPAGVQAAPRVHLFRDDAYREFRIRLYTLRASAKLPIFVGLG